MTQVVKGEAGCKSRSVGCHSHIFSVLIREEKSSSDGHGHLDWSKQLTTPGEIFGKELMAFRELVGCHINSREHLKRCLGVLGPEPLKGFIFPETAHSGIH